MEQLPALGTAIARIVGPTHKIYAPLLRKNAPSIKSTPRETSVFGQHPQQTLDVYKPSDQSSFKGNSVLIHLYGGGLVTGDKSNPDYAEGLTYANIAHFFVTNLGCSVVVPNYRLLKHGAVSPSGAEDLSLVIDWVTSNLGQAGDVPVSLFIMGHSAGGIHLSTYLFSARFAESRQRILEADTSGFRLKGVMFVSVPFHFKEADAERSKALKAYYGDDLSTNSPMQLLTSKKEEGSIEELRDLRMISSAVGRPFFSRRDTTALAALSVLSRKCPLACPSSPQACFV